MRRYVNASVAVAPDPSADLPLRSDGHTSSPPFTPGILSEPDPFGVEQLTSVQELFEARVHLGHKTSLWNPLMKPYLLGSRSGVHIFDLDMTLRHLRQALTTAGHIAYRKGVILFVSARSQFEYLVQETARGCGEYFVTQRWRGGTLTNSFMLLGTLRLPDLVVFLSVRPSKTAVREAAASCIPSIGVLDSDCDPRLVMYPIPGNDDTPSAVQLYCRLLVGVVNRAKERRRRDEAEGAISEPEEESLRERTK